MNVHLVFNPEYIEMLADELETKGFHVQETDSNLDDFVEWAQSEYENISDVAFVYAALEFNDRQDVLDVFEKIRTIRASRPELRLIFAFTSNVQKHVEFLERLIELEIYDLYFEDELTVEQIIESLENKKTIADVQQFFYDDFEDEIPSKSSFLSKIKNPLSNVKIKPPSFSFLGGSPTTKTNLVQSKVIAVGSLNGGAGSTFLIHNFVDYLSSNGFQAGVLEATEKSPVWLQIRGREIGQIPPQFESWLTQIKNTSTFNVRSKIEANGVHTIPLAVDDTFSNVGVDTIQTVIFTARQIPLLFVDISTDWENNFAKETLKICDEFWIVVNPDPNHLSSQRHKKKTMLNLAFQKIGEENCVFIGNKWGKGVDVDEFPIQPVVTFPYYEKEIQASMKGKSLYALDSRLFKATFPKLSKRVVQPIRTKESFFN